MSLWQFILCVFIGISLIAVNIILYNFLLVFITKNKRKKLICGIITIFIVILSFFLYIKNNEPHMIQMQEDILYIKPKSNLK